MEGLHSFLMRSVRILLDPGLYGGSFHCPANRLVNIVWSSYTVDSFTLVFCEDSSMLFSNCFFIELSTPCFCGGQYAPMPLAQSLQLLHDTNSGKNINNLYFPIFKNFDNENNLKFNICHIVVQNLLKPPMYTSPCQELSNDTKNIPMSYIV